jgi:hypothetical protein
MKMLRATEKSILFVLDNVENGQKLLDADDLGAILDALDELSTSEMGMDEEYNITDFGREAERALDDLYISNE